MSEDEILDLLTGGEAQLRAAFAEVLSYLREQNQLGDIEQAIADGRVEDALDEIDAAAAKLSEKVTSIYTDAAIAAAESATRQAGTMISFHATNPEAVRQLQQDRDFLVSSFATEQREVIRNIISQGIGRGDNPREMAREIRDSIGLTPTQQQWVDNYRTQLETGRFAQAMDRELHDGRFDRAIEAAERRARGLGELPTLGDDQIDRMVVRYRQNMIGMRAENIARTQALRAVHQGADETYRQAVHGGKLDPRQMQFTWHSGAPPRTRNWHYVMNGQTVMYGQLFVSGLGNELRYPGDPDAPGEEVISCRCARSLIILR